MRLGLYSPRNSSARSGISSALAVTQATAISSIIIRSCNQMDSTVNADTLPMDPALSMIQSMCSFRPLIASIT